MSLETKHKKEKKLDLRKETVPAPPYRLRRGHRRAEEGDRRDAVWVPRGQPAATIRVDVGRGDIKQIFFWKIMMMRCMRMHAQMKG
jgi:hypothetical protein